MLVYEPAMMNIGPLHDEPTAFSTAEPRVNYSVESPECSFGSPAPWPARANILLRSTSIRLRRDEQHNSYLGECYYGA